MDSLLFVETCTVIACLVDFLLPIFSLVKISRAGNTGRASSLVYVHSLLTYSTYLRFAYISEDEPMLVMIYLTGTICYLIYVPIFYAFCQAKAKMLLRLAIAAVLQLVIALYDMHETDYTSVRRYVGYVNALFYTSLYIMPLAKMASILTSTQDTAGLSSVGMMSTFMVTFCWTLYGLFDWNPYVQIPNIVCCLFSGRVIDLYIKHSPHH